jgi:hypothetical protein
MVSYMSSVANLLLVNVLYELFDSGLANTLGLETLNHGTSFSNYLSIRMIGGDPNHGGKETGSTKGLHIRGETKNCFYVFKDSEFNYIIGEFNHASNNSSKFNLLYIFNKMVSIKGIGNRILPRVHAAISGYNFVARMFSGIEDESSRIKHLSVCLSSISGIFNALFSPRLRFRFANIDSKRFQNDDSYSGGAYLTEQAIEPWRIGLLGSLLVGVINADLFARMKANPHKVLTGVIQISTALVITTLYINTIVANPALVIAGILIS